MAYVWMAYSQMTYVWLTSSQMTYVWMASSRITYVWLTYSQMACVWNLRELTPTLVLAISENHPEGSREGVGGDDIRAGGNREEQVVCGLGKCHHEAALQVVDHHVGN